MCDATLRDQGKRPSHRSDKVPPISKTTIPAPARRVSLPSGLMVRPLETEYVFHREAALVAGELGHELLWCRDIRGNRSK